MEVGRGEYFATLSTGGILEGRYVDDLLEAMASRLRIEALAAEVFDSAARQAKITEKLSRLPLRVARGPRSWGGVVLGFPGVGRAADNGNAGNSVPSRDPLSDPRAAPETTAALRRGVAVPILAGSGLP